MTDQAPAPYAGVKRVLSGVQPSGDLHLGNYLGALVKFTRLQHETDTFIFVADLHALCERVLRVHAPPAVGPPRAGDASRSVLDTTRAARDLGFTAAVALADGIESIVAAPA